MLIWRNLLKNYWISPLGLPASILNCGIVSNQLFKKRSFFVLLRNNIFERTIYWRSFERKWMKWRWKMNDNFKNKHNHLFWTIEKRTKWSFMNNKRTKWSFMNNKRTKWKKANAPIYKTILCTWLFHHYKV